MYDTKLSAVYKLIDHLKSVFPKFHVVKSEAEFFDHLKEHQVDIALVNIDVSPLDGIAVVKELSTKELEGEQHRRFCIIYSEKQDDFLQELAYNSGADAFLNIKQSPVLFELIIKSMARRVSSKKHLQNISKELLIDEEEYVVLKQGQKIELPKKEFSMLLLLYKNNHKFFSKKELALQLWKDEGIANKRTIDVHIYNIRQVFGKHIIQSQKGKGYRINKKYFA